MISETGVWITVRILWFPVRVTDGKYSLCVELIMTHSRGSRCQWIPPRRSSWSSRRAGWCSGRVDRTHWMRCATPAFGCHWLPQQRCNCQSLGVIEVGGGNNQQVKKLEWKVYALISSWIMKYIIKFKDSPGVTLTLVSLAVVLELWTGLALVIVWAAAVEISHQAVALGLIVTWVRAARVILHLEMENREVEACVLTKALDCFEQCVSYKRDRALTSQVVPAKPCGHSHMNPSSRAWQRPPFLHGLLAQRFLWTSQCRPKNPAWQTHW